MATRDQQYGTNGLYEHSGSSTPIHSLLLGILETSVSASTRTTVPWGLQPGTEPNFLYHIDALIQPITTERATQHANQTMTKPKSSKAASGVSKARDPVEARLSLLSPDNDATASTVKHHAIPHTKHTSEASKGYNGEEHRVDEGKDLRNVGKVSDSRRVTRSGTQAGIVQQQNNISAYWERQAFVAWSIHLGFNKDNTARRSPVRSRYEARGSRGPSSKGE